MEEVGKHHLVMIDGHGKKENQLSGLTDTNKRAVFIPNSQNEFKVGDLVVCKVIDAS